MAEEDTKDVKELLCSSCKKSLPSTHYSGKQIKLKGKRKCKDCAVVETTPAESSSSSAADTKKADFLKGALFTDQKGKDVVKTVSAFAVERANKEVVKGALESSPDDDKFDVLIKWLKAGGAKFPHLLMKFYTVDYRGVHAKKRIEEGEIILEVPLPMIITSDAAHAGKICQAIKASGYIMRSDHSWLASHLLQEKYDPLSYHKPYIDCLPVHYRNMPTFFEPDELSYLSGSFSLKMIRDRQASLKMEYDGICAAYPEFKKYHHLDFFWARFAVITRIFGFEVKGTKTDGLVAMADMLNHKHPNETTWNFDDSRNAFTITTTKRILKGAQIYDSYGRKCNSRFFVNYGFSLEQNEDNQAVIQYVLPKEDPQFVIKAKLLNINAAGASKRFQIPFEHKEKVTRRCMTYLRIAHATLEELLPLVKKGSFEKILAEPGPVSARNETEVIKTVAEMAKHSLSLFSTSLADDNKMLADPEKKLTMNIRNCLLMRRGEKEVLQAYVDLAEHVSKVSQMDLKEAQKYIAKNIKGIGREPSIEWRMENFFEDIWLPMLTGKKVEIQEMDNSLEAD